MKTKTSKQEAEFFRYFDNVQVTESEQEVWERFVSPISRYLKEDYNAQNNEASRN